MTQTIHYLPIIVIAAILIGSISVGTVAFADDDDKKGTPISFVWDPADTSSDPTNLIVVTGSFTRVGLLSDSTTAVQGAVAGNLKDKIKNESITIQETSAGSTTITTTVEAHSQIAGKLQGIISIDGEDFDVKLKPKSVVTQVTVTDVFSNPTQIDKATLGKTTIPVEVKMEADGVKFEGFGVIRDESNTTEFGGSIVIIRTFTLEAEIIGDTGFFELKMLHFQRTVEVSTP